MNEQQHRALYDEAVDRFRVVAGELARGLGPVDGASVCVVVAAELLGRHLGAAGAAEYLRKVAENVEQSALRQGLN